MRSFILLFLFSAASAFAAELLVTSYPSIQEALNANPSRMIFVPAGDYTITEKIRIRGERSGLFGPGRIIQQSADQPIIEIEIEIENANGAQIRDLTLTRPEGKMETLNEVIIAIKCRAGYRTALGSRHRERQRHRELLHGHEGHAWLTPCDHHGESVR